MQERQCLDPHSPQGDLPLQLGLHVGSREDAPQSARLCGGLGCLRRMPVSGLNWGAIQQGLGTMGPVGRYLGWHLQGLSLVPVSCRMNVGVEACSANGWETACASTATGA